MQLRMVARRARDGALTILGDVAQATGAVAYRRWDEVLPHLPRGDEARSRSCATPTACRARSWSSRCRCSTTIAPDVAPPISYRTGRRRRRRSAASARSTCSRRPTARPRGSREPDGLLAVIVPDELVADAPAGDLWDGVPAADAARGEGPRVRPRRRRRAGADRRARAGPARALRRADPADEDARRRPRAAAARRAHAVIERQAVP